jgi:hypothetical protein
MSEPKIDMAAAKEAAQRLVQWIDDTAFQPPEVVVPGAAQLVREIAAHMELRREVRGEEQLRKVLKSMFYDLARDHVTIGKLNAVIRDALPETMYTDKELAQWCEKAADRIYKKAEQALDREGARSEEAERGR